MVFSSSVLWAEQGRNDLREQAIEQIYAYAEQLYARGNYGEAKRAFGHILQLNPEYIPALAYARKLREHIQIPQPQATCCVLPKTNPVSSINPADSNADLRAELAIEEQALSTLNEEVIQLRAATESMSHEEE